MGTKTLQNPSPVLVTGGGGFLGQAVIKALHAKGHTIRSYSRKHYPYLDAYGVKSYQGDLCDDTALREAMAGVAAVFHIAAKAGVSGDFQSYHHTNVLGTRNVLRLCQELGIRSLIYTSTPSVTFDGRDQNGVDESMGYAKRFLNAYQETKAIAEQEVRAAHSPRLKTVALRPHLIWGPGDTQLVPRILARAQAGKLAVIGRGDKLVDAVYIDNAAHAHILAWQGLETGQPIGGQAYFVTNHEPWPLRKIITGIVKAAGMEPQLRAIPMPLGYAAGALFEARQRWQNSEAEPPLTRFVARQLATAHWYSPKKAIEELGYRPQVSMREGFQRLAAYFNACP